MAGVLLFAVLCLGDPGAEPKKAKSPKPPAGKHEFKTASAPVEYSPNRLIVKFKAEGENRFAHDPRALPDKARRKDLAPYDSLHALNDKCGLVAVRSLFFNNQAADPAALEKIQEQWVNKIKARFPERAKRAPDGVVPPDLTKYFILEFKPGTDVKHCRDMYRANPFVESAKLDEKAKINEMPNDPYYNSTGTWGQPIDDLWGLKRVNAEAAWESAQGAKVVVAVLDTGVDYKHPDIAENVWANQKELPGSTTDTDGNGFVGDARGWDFVGEDNDPMDESGVGHGTHVAGIIAAVRNNGEGIVGVAPKAKIMPVRISNASGQAEISAGVRGFMYAVENGADVINNSWNPSEYSDTAELEDVIRLAHSLGVVTVFSSGNTGAHMNARGLPRMREVISVGGVFPDDSPADFSSWGRYLDVVAPGGSPGKSAADPTRQNRSILSLRASSVPDSSSGVGTKYLRLSGTSQAAPFVSGVAALVLSRRPHLSNDAVAQILKASADDIGEPNFDLKTGAGVVNAEGALRIDDPLRVRLTAPAENFVVRPGAAEVMITGVADGAGFESYRLTISRMDDLRRQMPLGPPARAPGRGVLHRWNVSELKPGTYLLRLEATDKNGRRYVDAVQLFRDGHPRTELTPGAGTHTTAAVFGNRACFVRSAGDPVRTTLIVRDLTSNEDRTVPTPGAEDIGNVAIDGRSVFYRALTAGKVSVTQYDLASGKSKVLSESETAWVGEEVAVSGDRVAWVDAGNVYCLSPGDDRPAQLNALPEDGSTAQVAIDGHRVVWCNNSRVHAYDLKGKTLTILASARQGNNFRNPRISGTDVVWAEDVQSGGRQFNLYATDLRSRHIRRLASNLEQLTGPSLSHRKVVWSDARTGNKDVYLYDLATETETPLTPARDDQFDPVISEGRVVWRELQRIAGPSVLRISVFAARVSGFSKE